MGEEYKAQVNKEATAMLRDIKTIKGYVSKNDAFVAMAYAQNNGFIKQSGAKWDWIGKWIFGFGKGPTAKDAVKKKGLISALWRFLIRAATYLGIFAVAGGSKKVVEKELGITEGPEVGKSTATLYKNTQGNVVKTIVEYLNAEFDFDYKGKVLSFSEMYKQMSGQDIEISQPMQQVLSAVRGWNGGQDIATMNGWGSFNGPPIDDMYKTFFPKSVVPTVDSIRQEPQVAKANPVSKETDSEIISLMSELKGA